MRIVTLLSCVTLGLAAVGCASSRREPIKAVVMDQKDQVGAPSRAVAVSLYGQIRTKPGNVFFSPFSIAEALAMTDVGARGQTDAQLKALLGADPSAYGAWAKEVNGKHAEYELHTGNALWVQQGEPFQADFLKKLKEAFDATPRTADFHRAAQAAVNEINEWIAQQTNGKITKLLSSRSLDASTRLVLANAVYFKGTWLHTFGNAATSNQPFHAAGGKDVQVAMMSQRHSFPLYQDDALQVLELPYKGNALSMLVLLPRKADGLEELEKSLTAEKLAAWSEGVRSQRVDVELPKFTMRQTLDLVPVLKAVGVRDLLTSGQADLSGIDGTRELYASSVAHGAFVKVDEEGTEAAAATVVGVAPAAIIAGPIQTFRADHPFLFVIRHNATGGIVFMGRVAEPESKD